MAAQLFYNPINAVLSRGLPQAGAQATFYLSGTTTKASVYASSGLTTTLSNPVVADGAGLLPAIYLDSTKTYRVVIADSLGVTIPGCDIDPYTPGTIIGGLQGAPGTNGGTASNLTIGRFIGAAGMNLTAGGTLPAPEVVNTSGYLLIGKGAARYVKDTAVDAAFVTANPRWSFRDSQGNGYRLSNEQLLTLEMFGGVGDWTGSAGTSTDDYPAFQAAMKFQETYRYATSGNSDYKVTPTVWLSNHAYYVSQTLNFDRAAYVYRSMGSNHNGLGGAVIVTGSGRAGAVFQSWNTTGLDLVETTTAHTIGTDPRGAAGSLLEDISFYSVGGTVGATDQNGVLSHTNMTLRRVYCYDFGGNGIAFRADVGQGSNANLFVVEDCGASRCGLNGFYDQGGDANAARVTGFNAISNRQWGIYAANFLGNWYMWGHTQGNGIAGAGPAWATNNVSTRCSYGGRYYRVRPGQHVTASTTTPGTNSAVWVDEGAAALGGAIAWVTGLTWCSGGPFYAGSPTYTSQNSARNVFAMYVETDQPLAWSDSSSSVCMPGFNSWNGSNLYVENYALLSQKIGAAIHGTTTGRNIYATLGGLGGDNAFLEIGNSTTNVQSWQFKIDDSNIVFPMYGGLGNSIPYYMRPTGIGMVFPRGISGVWPTYASNAAAVTAGLAVGDVYQNSSGQLFARV